MFRELGPTYSRHDRGSSPEVQKPIPDLEIGNLLAAIGNHEAKAILLVSMQAGRIYTRADLGRLLRQIQDNNGWNLEPTVLLSYCQYSLVPIGLVAQEVIDPDMNTFGFVKTSYGSEYGDALAGSLLAFSERHPLYSLRQVFASTHVPRHTKDTIDNEQDQSIRATHQRIKILRALTTEDLPISIRGLEMTTRISSNVITNHLLELARGGLVIYNPASQGRPRVEYDISSTILDSPPVSLRSNHTLTQRVYDLLPNVNKFPITAKQITNLLLELYPEYEKWTQRSICNVIVNILSDFSRQGYLTNIKHDLSWTKINITPEQKHVLEDAVDLIDHFQLNDSTFLESQRRLAASIISRSEKVSRLMEKAKDFSSHANRPSAKETLSLITSAVTNNPGTTANELVEILQRDYGYATSRGRLLQLLAKAQKQGSVQFNERKKKRYWTVVENNV